MKKHRIAAIASFSLVFAMPALAGPNWQVIHAAEQHASQNDRIILPLDHGPRALSTPWENRQERLEIIAREQKAQSVRVASHSAKHPRTKVQ